ncbi:MAG: hypothetical protein AB1916_12365 [Thermodesulfobacteriota bacterium]
MRDALIYGGGRLGRQVYALVRRYLADRVRVLGFIDDVQPPGAAVIDGLATVGGLEAAGSGHLDPSRAALFLAIGYADMAARGRAFLRAKGLSYEFLTLVHPQAVVEPDAILGEGCVVLAGTVLDQRVEAGAACYFDIGVRVGEYSTLDFNNYLAAGCVAGGSVRMGRDNFFGLNATLVNDISVGDGNFVNAASLLHRDLGSGQQYIEVRQARSMSRRPAGGGSGS